MSSAILCGPLRLCDHLILDEQRRDAPARLWLNSTRSGGEVAEGRRAFVDEKTDRYLIQRPIVEKGAFAILVRPADRIREIL